jgi:hypothetical protein
MSRAGVGFGSGGLGISLGFIAALRSSGEKGSFAGSLGRGLSTILGFSKTSLAASGTAFGFVESSSSREKKLLILSTIVEMTIFPPL